MGLIKQIGSGESIAIWTGRWIPGTSSVKPVGRIGNAQLDKVADLIDSQQGTWDVDVVRNNFLAHDVEAILNIPLRTSGGEDFYAWALER